MKCEIKTENEIILIKTQNIYYNTRWSTFFSFRVLNLLEMTILFCDINFTMLISKEGRAWERGCAYISGHPSLIAG